MGLNALAHSLHDLRIDADQIIAAHARFARNTGGDDDHIRPFQVRIVIGARHFCIKPFNRGGLCDVQRLALRHAVNNVENNNVTQLLQTSQKRQGSANISRANQRNLVPCHEFTALSLRPIPHCVSFLQCPYGVIFGRKNTALFPIRHGMSAQGAAQEKPQQHGQRPQSDPKSCSISYLK